MLLEQRRGGCLRKLCGGGDGEVQVGRPALVRIGASSAASCLEICVWSFCLGGRGVQKGADHKGKRPVQVCGILDGYESAEDFRR